MLTAAQQQRELLKKAKVIAYWSQIEADDKLECRVCHQLLSLKDNFTPCTKKFKETGYLTYNKECKACRKGRHFHDRNFVRTSLEDVLKDRLYATSVRALNKKLSIDIDLDFLLDVWNKQNGKCFYTNKNMSLEINNPDKVSIDRINSSVGYTKENIVLCRNVINYMKNDLNLDQFKMIIEELYSNLNG